MKFLVDAQLPKSLADLLNSEGFDAIHSKDLPKENFTTDSEILDVAEKEGRILITKDLDFLHSFLVTKRPNQLVLIKTGNIRNKILLDIFKRNISLLKHMLQRTWLIEVYQDRIVERF